MDQNRPLTPQEREWQREKQQLPPEADSDTLDGSVQLTPEDLAKLRQAQGGYSPNRPGNNAPDQPPEGATIPAIPLNIPRNNPPAPPLARPQTPGPNPAELEWHREKQFPGGNQPAPGRGPEALPTQQALPQVSRQSPPPPVAPETLPTRQALPPVQRPQPGPPPTGQSPMTAPALPNQPRPQGGPPPSPVPPPPNPNLSRPYQPLGQPPQGAPRLTPEEMQWQREKQAYPGMTPQEMQWQREKQVYPTEQTRPAPPPPPGMTPQERQWQQEKQGYGAGAAGLTPQERQWQQEKQGYAAPVPGMTPQERQWQQEKQAYPVAPGAVPPNNRPGPVPPGAPSPYDRPVTVAQPPERRRGGWVWFLIPLVLLLIAAAVVVFLLLVKPGSDNPTATATASVAQITGTPAVTGGSTTTTPGTPGTPGTPSVTGTPNTTPGVTTGGALNPGQLTATAQAGTSPTAGTSAAQNEDLFNQGKSAFDNQQWLDAIAAWEKIDPNSDTYAKTKPLLATAYYNQANTLALDGTDTDSLTQAIGYYNKASALAPDNADFRTGAENASFYQSGSKALSAQDWDTAVNLLNQLYSRNPAFRDTALLYFNALVGQGDAQVASGNLVAAKDSYSTALGLTFKGTPPDTTALQAKLADVNTKLNPTPTASPSPSPAPTPTKKPAPTPTKKPAPTATPLPPCSKGGSGSNFFPFRTGQPPVPNVPDQGRSGVRGVVLDRNGAPVAGATVRIATNGHVFTSVTDGGGNYFREGLGRGTWTISVTAAPGRTICYGAPGSVMLSGQSGFYGSVDFTESVP
jgi:hypothetical protein